MNTITVVVTALQIIPHCVMVLNSVTAAVHRVPIVATALQSDTLTFVILIFQHDTH